MPSTGKTELPHIASPRVTFGSDALLTILSGLKHTQVKLPESKAEVGQTQSALALISTCADFLTFCEIRGPPVPLLLCSGAEAETTSSGRNSNWKCQLPQTFIRKDRILGTVPRFLHFEYFKIFEESSMHGINFNVQRTPEITFFFPKSKANSIKGR